ncbi:MAG: hypothetical protein Q7T97_02475 [Burkholderiaceae bacterium]|nr:hypothetical protein [Burkholderiaceae bacterium]
MGITTTVERVDGRVRIGKTYDAEPMLIEAAAARAATDGERWGEFRKVGEVPMAELATFYRQDGGLDNKRLLAWVRANPLFCWFNKALK